MKLYLLIQDVNNSYDTYDSMVVAAEDAEQARMLHPEMAHMGNNSISFENRSKAAWKDSRGSWAFHPEQVDVELLGQAIDEIKQPTIILASFNAG